jgi:hypothetical protein
MPTPACSADLRAGPEGATVLAERDRPRRSEDD